MYIKKKIIVVVSVASTRTLQDKGSSQGCLVSVNSNFFRQSLLFHLFTCSLFFLDILYNSWVATLIFAVHLFSVLRMIRPALVNLLLLLVTQVSLIFVCSFTYDARLLSLHITPGMFLSIPLCAFLMFFSLRLLRDPRYMHHTLGLIVYADKESDKFLLMIVLRLPKSTLSYSCPLPDLIFVS